jgi:flagellar capping protein FliD
VQTAGTGIADFKAKLRDGTEIDVSLGEVTTLGQVVDNINASAPNKLRAEITEDGKIKISDLTAGATTFALQQMNASQFLFDLGLTTASADGAVTGKLLKIDNALNSITGGIGINMQQRLNKLIDPVSGILTRQNKTLDARTDQYKERIEDLDKLLAGKRLRLERQFSGLESSLAQLQTQQQSLGSIQNLSLQNR